ncbi:hypothetical protein K431DRAFT_281718 [Polychaeton citri CBS 116435]|uniref:Uncharacterized protein n=1 Tax=Polychaeton citri CBS 116435 TaxID=1314669 RepID=A0A9P4QE55_9PEZI|nr:hypothetical protein K431DRAFT_281718 [Polychaeton citri CBS 116435]
MSLPNESSASLPQQTQAGQPPIVPKDADVRETTGTVPDEVVTSQKEARIDPEASGVPAMVEEKQHMEQELLKRVQETQQAGEPAPVVSAETSSKAPE